MSYTTSMGGVVGSPSVGWAALGAWFVLVPGCVGEQSGEREVPGFHGQAGEVAGEPGPGVAGAPGGAGAGASTFHNGDGGPGEVLVAPDAGAGDLTERNCGVAQFALRAKRPPDVHVVLDKSESMRVPWGGSTPAGADEESRWESVGRVLERVLESLQDKIRFGLALYPYAPPGSCNCPLGWTVDPADAGMCCWMGVCNMACSPGSGCSTAGVHVEVDGFHADEILEAIDAAEPDGATPTRAAVQAATGYLAGVAGSGDRYLLLATDGAPNCGGGVAESVCPPGTKPDFDKPLGNCCKGGDCSFGRIGSEELATVNAIADAKAAGIPTFVVGMALPVGLPDYDVRGVYSMNQGAVAGGTARADGPPYFHPADDGASLEAALLSIAGQIIGCEYLLSEPPPDPDNMLLVVDSGVVERGGSDGWELAGPDEAGDYTIELSGAACEALRNAPSASITAYLGCPGEPIEAPL